MLKKIIAVLLLVCFCSCVFAIDMSKAEPFADDEFPKWVLDLRRGEILTFGMLPLSFMVVNLGYNIAGADMTDETLMQRIGISAAVAAAIAIADYIIGIVQK